MIMSEEEALTGEEALTDKEALTSSNTILCMEDESCNEIRIDKEASSFSKMITLKEEALATAEIGKDAPRT